MLGRGLVTALLIIAAAAPAAAQDKQPPYWASVASGQALSHTGPGKNYPNIWLYQRRDLPIRVVKKYENWRLIQDPDGAQGWMLVTVRRCGTSPSTASSAASTNAATVGAGSRSASARVTSALPISGA
jgi:SH3-like domain-containing protein